MSQPESRQELCPICLAFPQDRDVRVIIGRPDGSTLETWHKNGCPNAEPPFGYGSEPTA